MSHESRSQVIEPRRQRGMRSLVAPTFALLALGAGGCAGAASPASSPSGAHGAGSARTTPDESAWVSIGAIEVQGAAVGAVSADGVERDRSYLTNVEWRWTRLVDPMAGPLEVENQRHYVIVLLEDGRAVVRADCNTEVGQATFAEDGSMSMDLPKRRLQPCGVYSMSTEFVNNLESAERYYVEQDELVIELGHDAGLMEFTRGPVATYEARR